MRLYSEAVPAAGGRLGSSLLRGRWVSAACEEGSSAVGEANWGAAEASGLLIATV